MGKKESGSFPVSLVANKRIDVPLGKFEQVGFMFTGHVHWKTKKHALGEKGVRNYQDLHDVERGFIKRGKIIRFKFKRMIASEHYDQNNMNPWNTTFMKGTLAMGSSANGLYPGIKSMKLESIREFCNFINAQGLISHFFKVVPFDVPMENDCVKSMKTDMLNLLNCRPELENEFLMAILNRRSGVRELDSNDVEYGYLKAGLNEKLNRIEETLDRERLRMAVHDD